MATLVFSPAQVCAGGEHITLTMTLDGGASRTFRYEVEELRTDLPDDTIRDAALVVLRLASRGRSRTQVRNAVLAGFTVTI